MSTEALGGMMMVTEKTGRAAIIIEGDQEKIAPYLEAVEALMAREGVTT